MLKVLLIDASSSWLVNRGDLFDLEQIIPPIGLMYIAAYLKHELKDEIEVKLLNRIADCRTQKDLLNILREYKPDVVGIRGLNIYKDIFHETARITKEFKNSAVVVGGGPYVTMDIEDAAKDKNIDYFVIGEGEITFTELIRKLLNGQGDSLDIRGLVYRKGQALARNPLRDFIEDLDSLPFPDYNLISTDRYSEFTTYGYNRRRQAIILSSRGCPYQCIFCHNIFGRNYRGRSPLNVFKEIEKLYKNFNIKDFYFVDDNFNLEYKRAMELFDLVINNNMKINIYLANGIRGDIVDKVFIDKMVRAGVIWVTYSIETASKRLQRFIKKSIDLEEITDNIHYTCKKGIMVNCCIMAGFPTETKQEALQTIEFLKQFKKITIPMFFSVKYYPNTEIYNLAIKNGIKTDNIQDAYAETYHDIRHSHTPLIPKKAFRDIYFKFLSEVFLSKERLLNAIEIQRRFLTEEEILDTYSIFFRKRIRDLEKDVLYYAN